MAPVGDSAPNVDDNEVVNPETSGVAFCNDTDSDPTQEDGTESSSLAPPSVSNPSGRGRSRHRHHRRHRSRFRFKRKETNFLAAVCSMVVLVLLCTAMAVPKWFTLNGGGCRDYSNIPIHDMGINQFFYLGTFIHSTPGKLLPTQTVYQYGSSQTEVLKDCVTGQIVSIMKSIICLCFFGIMFSLAAFMLNLSGPTHRLLKLIHRNGVCNILTVAVCIVVNGFCYWATEWLQNFQHITKVHKGSKVQVQFGIGFYLVTAAGAMSVVGSACSLLRRHASHEPHDREQRQNLLDDYDGMDFSQSGQEGYAPLFNMPPPPPYSP